ncbi:MAG TPA: hypothetical protein VFC56_10335, partial [Stellaceae bacterium]|nr:hypothetical protein [Stellaceae bacterium]
LSSAAAPLPSSFVNDPSNASNLSNGTLCSTCAYTQWGYWGGAVNSNFGGGGPRSDFGHLNFWVAGQPTVNLPTMGTGLYNGGMIGSVNNSGLQYIATGNFNLNYDFGARTGSFGINTFDGQSPITVPVGAVGAGYSGVKGASGPGLSATIAGGFFGPNSPLPPETAGSFSLFKSGYQAAGVFQGHR